MCPFGCFYSILPFFVYLNHCILRKDDSNLFLNYVHIVLKYRNLYIPVIINVPDVLGVPSIDTTCGPDSAGRVMVAGIGSKFSPSVRKP